MIGAESRRKGAFGGFHHPDQGYRHLQMFSVVTMYGPMAGDSPERPELALLDLLRSYAHDCLHYGSRRRYLFVNGELTRTQYGINFRRPSGEPYSAVDPRGAPYTRNLGIVMEGACDREARRLTRETAAQAGIREPLDMMGRLAFRDVTGTLSPGDMTDSSSMGEHDEANRYVAGLRAYETGVNRRYALFLTEFAPGEEEELHDLLLGAVVSGETRGLSEWLDVRHGPGAFAGVFLTGSYFRPPHLERGR